MDENGNSLFPGIGKIKENEKNQSLSFEGNIGLGVKVVSATIPQPDEGQIGATTIKKEIKVRVYLPSYLDRTKLDNHGNALIEEGSTLKDLLGELGIPFPAGMVHLCRVNYEKADLKRELHEGDIVSFFSLISGG
ncbi:MAG TPA: MoaD/ThiS family protein [Candidatus Limnocylindrales bacterium]|nr:MoaD/ThiS family protein [Candidatus Limnocylindrales bacterium]